MANTEKRVIVADVQVEQKQLNDAVMLVQLLTKSLGDLKKKGRSVSIIKDTEAKIRETIRAVETLRTERKKEGEQTLAFGVKKLEFTKLELQKQRELLSQAKANAREEDKIAKQQLRAAEKAQKALEEEEMWLTRQAKTLGEIEQQNRALVRSRKQLDLTSSDNIEKFNALTEAIAANQQKLNEHNADIGRFQGNVGNYTSAWEGMPGPLGNVVEGVQGVGDAFRMLLANPIVALIAGITAALALLFNQFMKTERGQQLFNKASDYMNAALDQLTNLMRDLSNYLANISMDEFIEDMKELGKEFIKNSLAGKAFTAVFETVSKAAKGEWGAAADAAVEGAKDVGIAFVETVNPVAGLAKTFRTLNGAVKDGVDAYAALRAVQKNVEFASFALETQIAKLAAQEQLLQATVDDDTKSFIEREKAVKQLNAVTEQQAKLTKANAQNLLLVATRERDLQKARGISVSAMLEYERAVVDAELALIEANNNYMLTVRDNTERVKKMRRDEAEQALDFILDIYDVQKSINERIIKQETTTQEQRVALLESTKQAAEESLQDQLAVFSRFTDKRIDFDAILNESDAKRRYEMAKNLGFDEIVTNRFLEAIRERETYIQDFAELEQEVAKMGTDAKKKAYEEDVKLFEKEQELDKLKFEQKQATDQEKREYEIQAKIEHDQKILELAQLHGMQMTELERAILEQRIANGQEELKAAQDLSDSKIKLRMAEIDAQNALLGAIRTTFGEESRLGKIAGAIQRGLALKKAILSSKEAILKAWASAPFPANLPAVGAATLSTGVLTAAIKAVKFEDGGVLPKKYADGGVISGPSHANGGVPVLGGRAEVEGGEFITNKASTAANLPALSLINNARGPVDFSTLAAAKFQDGGVLPSVDRAMQSAGDAPTEVVVQQPVLILDDLQDAMNTDYSAKAVQMGV